MLVGITMLKTIKEQSMKRLTLFLLSMTGMLTSFAMNDSAQQELSFKNLFVDTPADFVLNVHLSEDATETETGAELTRLLRIIEKRFELIVGFFKSRVVHHDKQLLAKYKDTLNALMNYSINEMSALRSLLFEMYNHSAFGQMFDTIEMQSFLGCLLNTFQNYHTMYIDAKVLYSSQRSFPQPLMNTFIHIQKSDQNGIQGYANRLVGSFFSVSKWFERMRSYETEQLGS